MREKTKSILALPKVKAAVFIVTALISVLGIAPQLAFANGLDNNPVSTAKTSDNGVKAEYLHADGTTSFNSLLVRSDKTHQERITVTVNSASSVQSVAKENVTVFHNGEDISNKCSYNETDGTVTIPAEYKDGTVVKLDLRNQIGLNKMTSISVFVSDSAKESSEVKSSVFLDEKQMSFQVELKSNINDYSVYQNGGILDPSQYGYADGKLLVKTSPLSGRVSLVKKNMTGDADGLKFINPSELTKGRSAFANSSVRAVSDNIYGTCYISVLNPGPTMDHYTDWNITMPDGSVLLGFCINHGLDAPVNGTYNFVGTWNGNGYDIVVQCENGPSAVNNLGLPCQQVGAFVWRPLGDIEVWKDSTEPGVTNGNPNYSVAGAGFVFRNNDTGDSYTVYTNNDGWAVVRGVPYGTYTVTETVAPRGYKIATSSKNITLSGGSASIRFSDIPKKGSAELIKKSSAPWYNNFSTYSIAGAVYSIYTNSACTQLYGTMTTDENGKAGIANLPFGSYWVKETIPSQGHKLDVNVHYISVTEEKLYTINSVDPAQVDPFFVTLIKKDADQKSNTPSGSASLAGAEYTVTFHDGYYTTIADARSHASKKTFVMKTSQASDGKYVTRVNFSDLIDNGMGIKGLPLGTYVIEETKAPEGYHLATDDPYLVQIYYDTASQTAKQRILIPSNAEDIVSENEFISGEEVYRSDLEFVKVGHIEGDDDDSASGENRVLPGIAFSVTSNTTGEKVYMVTDKDGYADSRVAVYANYTVGSDGKATGTNPIARNDRGFFVYDTYTIKEMNTPVGMIPIPDKVFTIDKSGLVYRFQFIDGDITSLLSIVKIDIETGKTIPAAGTTFELYTEPQGTVGRKPVEMRVTYPTNEVITQFKTNDKGQVTLPEKLPYGTYYVHEVNAPSGYILGTADIKVVVDTYHNWDTPIVVEYANVPQKGTLTINKTDEDTAAPLSGAVFEVHASNDIVTPDGTTRYTKDQLVDTITTNASGKATTKELYLGKYYMTEKGRLVISQNVDPTGVLTNVSGTITSQTGGETITGQAVKIKMEDLAAVLEENGKTYVQYFAELGAYNSELDEETASVIAYFVGKEIPAELKDIKHMVADWTYTTPILNQGKNIVPALKEVNGETAVENQKISSGDVLSYRYAYRVTDMPETLLTLKWTDEKGVSYRYDFAAKSIISDLGDVFKVDYDEVKKTLTLTDSKGVPVVYEYSYSVKDGIITVMLTTEKAVDDDPETEKEAESGNVPDEGENDTEKTTLTFTAQAFEFKWNVSFANVLSNNVKFEEGTATYGDKVTAMKQDGTGTLTASAEGVVNDGLVFFDYTVTVNDGIEDMLILNPYSYNDYNYIVNSNAYEAELIYAGQNVKVTTASADATNKVTEIVFKKTDITTGEPVLGAYLEVKDANGNVADSWITTEEEHLIKGLAPGKYVLTETLAPLADGYVRSIDVEFEVLADGTVNAVEMKDDYTKLTISKKDFTDASEIVGATLKITDLKGNEIATWVTNGTPHYMEYIAPGEYILTETAAPQGYLIAEQVKFKVDETGKIQTVSMFDKRDNNTADEDITKKVSNEVMSGTSDILNPALAAVGILAAIGLAVSYTVYRRKRK